jgi:macrolide-specific efflux system membrane fusion protein
MRKFLSFPFHYKKISFGILILLGCFVAFVASRPSAISLVETQTIKRSDLTQSLPATGSVDVTQSVDLSFVAGGKLVYLNAKKGDIVKAGQTIAVLDQRTMQKNLEVSLRDYSKERNSFEQANADHNTKKPDDAVNDTLKRILQDNQYDLEKSVLSVELQDLAKQQSVLTTPIGGVVIRADAKSAGINVSPATVFTVANPKSLVFKLDIDEADIGRVKEGLPVSLTLDAFADQTLHLSVDKIDFTTHTTSTGGDMYTVEARLPEQQSGNYRLGMNGDAEVILHRAKSVVIVPIASIINDSYVYVKVGETFEKRKIAIGLSDDMNSEVRSGLREGDVVAVDPTLAETAMKSKRFWFF